MNTQQLRISPLNLSGLVRRAREEAALFEGGAPLERPNPVVVYECAKCEERHDREDDAIECCADEPASADPTCPCCGEKYFDFHEAASCCLWKDFPAPTRWRIADAVEAGGTWAEQLGLAK